MPIATWTTPGRMRDAFRVYGAGEDGQWILLATNNTADDQGLNRNNHTGNSDVDEFDNNINQNFDPYGNDTANSGSL